MLAPAIAVDGNDLEFLESRPDKNTAVAHKTEKR